MVPLLTLKKNNHEKDNHYHNGSPDARHSCKRSGTQGILAGQTTKRKAG